MFLLRKTNDNLMLSTDQHKISIFLCRFFVVALVLLGSSTDADLARVISFGFSANPSCKENTNVHIAALFESPDKQKSTSSTNDKPLALKL